jgi:hypothetical protein
VSLKKGREREEGSKGERERGMEGGKEGGIKEGRKERRKEGRKGWRKEGRVAGRKEGRKERRSSLKALCILGTSLRCPQNLPAPLVGVGGLEGWLFFTTDEQHWSWSRKSWI